MTHKCWLTEERDIGSALHTALRKCCDSTPTSILYNLIHAADKEWDLVIGMIWEQFCVFHEVRHMQDLTPDEAVKALRTLGTEYYRHLDWAALRDDKDVSQGLLIAILLCLREDVTSDGDLRGMVEYLFEVTP